MANVTIPERPGHLRVLMEALDSLHVHAGRPSFRQMVTGTATEAGPQVTRDGVYKLFSKTADKVPNWRVLKAVVVMLANDAHGADPERTLGDFHTMWVAAEKEPFAVRVERKDPPAKKADVARNRTEVVVGEQEGSLRFNAFETWPIKVPFSREQWRPVAELMAELFAKAGRPFLGEISEQTGLRLQTVVITCSSEPEALPPWNTVYEICQFLDSKGDANFRRLHKRLWDAYREARLAYAEANPTVDLDLVLGPVELAGIGLPAPVSENDGTLPGNEPVIDQAELDKRLERFIAEQSMGDAVPENSSSEVGDPTVSGFEQQPTFERVESIERPLLAGRWIRGQRPTRRRRTTKLIRAVMNLLELAGSPAMEEIAAAAELTPEAVIRFFEELNVSLPRHDDTIIISKALLTKTEDPSNLLPLAKIEEAWIQESRRK